MKNKLWLITVLLGVLVLLTALLIKADYVANAPINTGTPIPVPAPTASALGKYWAEKAVQECIKIATEDRNFVLYEASNMPTDARNEWLNLPENRMVVSGDIEALCRGDE